MSALKNKLKFGRKHDNEGKYLEQNISDYRRESISRYKISSNSTFRTNW